MAFAPTFALALLTLVILHAKTHFILSALTTPAWRVETLIPTLLKVLVSAITTVLLLRVLGMLLVVARIIMGLELRGGGRRREKNHGQAVLYIYHKAKLFPTPALTPAAVREATCAVCLEEESGEDGAGWCNASLACGHAFHWGCVRPWLDARNTCPLCKRVQARRGIDAMGRVVE